MDSYYLEPDNEHKYNGHSLLNLRITSDLTARWSGALRVTNLLDEDYEEVPGFKTSGAAAYAGLRYAF